MADKTRQIGGSGLNGTLEGFRMAKNNRTIVNYEIVILEGNIVPHKAMSKF